MTRGYGNLRRSRLDNLSQRTRRLLAIASMLGLPGMFAWSAFWLKTPVPGIIWGPFSFVLILVTLVSAFVLYAFARDRANFGAQLDERQRQLRDRAWVLSYEVLSAVVVAAVVVIGVLVLGMGRVVTLDGSVVTGIAICAGVLIPLLPVAALAWVEPNPPAEA